MSQISTNSSAGKKLYQARMEPNTETPEPQCPDVLNCFGKKKKKKEEMLHNGTHAPIPIILTL